MASASSAWELHVAIAALLNADVTINALLNGDNVYSLTAPRDADFDYIVIGATTATDFALFGLVGEEMPITLHLWVAGEDQAKLLQLWGEVKRVLHYQPIALASP